MCVHVFDLIIVIFLSPIKMSAIKLGNIFQYTLIRKLACVGVERRLIDCPIKFAPSYCQFAEISVYNGNMQSLNY